MKVEKHFLLVVAGVVWFFAGFNIMRIGLQAGGGRWSLLMLAAALATYLLFHNAIFRNLVKKHTRRITGYEDARQSVFRFFDRNSYLIMFGMITLGVALRASHWWPDVCIASFYAGLGGSLVIAGVSFCLQYLRVRRAS